MVRSLLFVVFIGLFRHTIESETPAKAIHVEKSENAIAEPGSNRDPKFLLPILKWIKFANDMCTTTDTDGQSLMGTCYNEKECANFGGEAIGKCPENGPGVCCVLRVGCDGVLTKVGYFVSPANPPSMCMSTVKFPAGTIQVKLEFLSFDIAGPVDGDCDNDTFIVSGDVLPGSKINVICGSNSGQIVFIDVPSTTKGELKLTFVLNSALSLSRNWNIKASFVTSKDGPMSRCLQQVTTTTGMIQSLNYGGLQALNNNHYHICFATLEGFCDVDFTFSTFDFGQPDAAGQCTNDFIEVAGTKFCGTIPDLTFRANSTGPISIHVKTDDDNSLQQEGFKATYQYAMCP